MNNSRSVYIHLSILRWSLGGFVDGFKDEGGQWFVTIAETFCKQRRWSTNQAMASQSRLVLEERGWHECQLNTTQKPHCITHSPTLCSSWRSESCQDLLFCHQLVLCSDIPEASSDCSLTAIPRHEGGSAHRSTPPCIRKSSLLWKWTVLVHCDEICTNSLTADGALHL